jgi:hypothetical protein
MHAGTWGARTGLIGAIVASTCCAVPSLLVAVGLGGAVASLVSAAPAITFLSRHKGWVFAAVGIVLAVSWGAINGRLPTAWARARLCPTGASPRQVRRLWWISAAVYALSFGVAFLAGPVARLVGG